VRVRLSVDLDARDRYVIARYFGPSGPARATRVQARAFVTGAVRSAIREHADAFRGRQRATVKRLAQGLPPELRGAELRAPVEKQLSLLSGAGDGNL